MTDPDLAVRFCLQKSVDDPSIPMTTKLPGELARRMKMVSRSPSPEFSPLSIGEDFTPVPTYKSASTTSIDFNGLLKPPLELLEDLKNGCGGQLWPAGMVLSQHILRYHRNSLKNARMFVFKSTPPRSTPADIEKS